jgi:hypothetical protein
MQRVILLQEALSLLSFPSYRLFPQVMQHFEIMWMQQQPYLP